MRFESQRRAVAAAPGRDSSVVGGGGSVCTVGRALGTTGDGSLPSSALVRVTFTRLGALSRSTVPDGLLEWAARCDTEAGFPLLGTARHAEPYVALQWNGERAARAGSPPIDLVVLTGLVTAWLHDRSVGDLQEAVTRALAMDVDGMTAVDTTGVPVTVGVVTTAVCAGLLSGVPEEELPALADVAGTLMQVRPPSAETAQGRAMAAAHTAAAGWLACQVHLAGLTAYEGAFSDTMSTATLPADGPSLAAPVRQIVEDLR